MLILTRKSGQAIKIGGCVTITLIKSAKGSAKLGISAPDGVRIMRQEIDDGPAGVRRDGGRLDQPTD
jgi:carbon storage regulator